MVWTIIGRAVDCCLLLLAITTLSILWSQSQQSDDNHVFRQRIEVFQQETKEVIGKNTVYLEGRINNLAHDQDDYQFSTASRLSVLEGKVDVLVNENKQLKQDKVFIANNHSLQNTVVVGSKQEQ